MNYKLIMLPNPILISDEEIKEGDYFYCTRGDIFPNLIAKASEINFDLEDSDGDGQPTILYDDNKILYCFCKKIVAGIDSLPKFKLSDFAILQIGFLFNKSVNKFEVEVEMEINQCDGCVAGYPVVDNIHRVPYPSGSMVCKKDLYNIPKITNNTIEITKIIKA